MALMRVLTTGLFVLAGWHGVQAMAQVAESPATQLASETPGGKEVARKEADANFFRQKLEPFLKKHCVECHSGDGAEAGIDFLAINDSTPLEKQRPRWNQIRGLIEIGAMPPPEHHSLPSRDEAEAIAAWIERRINTVDCNLSSDPGRVTMRRLNNTEYDYTVRDLLGVDFSPSEIVAFPSDGVGNGFDNQGDVLTLSPLQMEKYFQAAKLITDRIIVADRESLRKQRGDGAQLTIMNRVTAKFLFAEGRYDISARMEFGDKKDENAGAKLLVDGEPVETFQVGSDRAKYDKSVELSAGWHEIGIEFSEDAKSTKPDFRRRLDVEYLEISGPAGGKPALPASHSKLFVAEPSDELDDEQAVEQAAEKIFQPLLRRAYRRQPSEMELRRIVQLVKLAKSEGESFENAVGIGLQSILVSPHFLFRIETEPSSEGALSEPLSDEALASRLSYFLWASGPDDGLLDTAAAGKLHSVHELESAAERMIQDPRSRSIVTEFFMQALGLDGLRDASPDAERFELWNDRLRDAMRHETELVCEEILKKDLSLLTLLTADFTFINPRMAEFYKLDFDGVKPDELYRQTGSFRRGGASNRRDSSYSREDEWIKVSLPSNRQGVLTHASILTLTSNPRDTSPVKRGKWILESVLGDPPPPAPPNVPSFDDTKNKHKNLTLRQQLEIHRANPSCASCHRVMDPLGLGFENFDAIGRWREKEGKLDIDASGELSTGEKFSGAKELVTILTSRERQIARHFITQLLTYALGRGLEPYDNCAVDKILVRAEKDGFRTSTIIKAIVSSDPFRLRRGQQENIQ